MTLLSRLEYYLSEKGRFGSFTMHMLGYPILMVSVAVLLCFSLSDVRPRPIDPSNIFFFLMIFVGLFLLFAFRSGRPRPSVGVVTIVMMYFVTIIMCAIPYMARDFSWSDSLFEAASGITTTGMTMMDITEFDTPLLMWRAVTGWIGGFMFIILFCLYMSEYGLSGRYLFVSGSSSMDSDVYKPRVMKVALRYLEIYVVSTIVMSIILRITGVDYVSAMVLSMSTISTTGFMPFTDSIDGLNIASKIVIALFMFITMFNFTTTFVAVVRRSFRPMKEDNEFAYLISWVLIIGVIALVELYQNDMFPEGLHGYADYLLVLLSMASTTGFVVHDYAWPASMVLIMSLASIVGGSIDSPTGGLKVSRMAIALKIMKNQVTEVAFPNEVKATRIRHVNVSKDLAYASLLTILIFLMVLVGGTILISLTEIDMETALCLATSAITTTGPGLYELGEFSELNTFATVVCFALMIIGRMEAVLFMMILSFKEVVTDSGKTAKVPDKIIGQIVATDPNCIGPEKIVQNFEKSGLFAAFDLGEALLKRYNKA